MFWCDGVERRSERESERASTVRDGVEEVKWWVAEEREARRENNGGGVLMGMPASHYHTVMSHRKESYIDSYMCLFIYTYTYLLAYLSLYLSIYIFFYFIFLLFVFPG